MRPVRLMYVTDPSTSALDVVSVAVAAVEGGADAVQVRGARTDRALFELGRAVVSAVGGRAAVFVNDRFDVALAAAADGVQLKDGGLAPADVRSVLAASVLRIGVSAHDGRGLARAARDGATHATIGPLNDAHGKPGRGRQAVARWIAEARAEGALPPSVLILGGVTPGDASWAAGLGAPGERIGIGGIRLFQDVPTLRDVRSRASELSALLS